MRGLAKNTTTLVRHAAQILAAGHPMTLRQLHYAIFSRAEIAYANNAAHYKQLSRAMTKARRLYREAELAGRKPSDLAVRPDWMVDETREGEEVSVRKDAEAYIEAIKRSYRRDNWQDQRFHCEVWSEKATILGAIRPVANEWGLTLRVCHGFASTGMEQQVGQLFAGLKRDIVIFYLGDHDPSGHVIEADIHNRVEQAAGRDFRMERLAIHAGDIVRFNLPPQAIKSTDSRASSFRKQFGETAATVELDALPPTELRERIVMAVKRLIDMETWDRQIAIQQVEFDCISRIGQQFRGLRQKSVGGEK